ncbi:MAG: hypothetical protein COV59_00695 [Candidatus Magasanikbacteria bacterium CG11_big_fil_rev_8_21_14_0_20_39_34]|uniref:Phosphoribulokinase/uridine kinase domain-containing protein n=1 Tax=Candidatus Magasanikbacteria bacterium CG11_big_fil_rev_8_21_14_0_20_39_34 TaxID=1974653 RepID=A0A2H0N6E4_9BACT|nr:MAG: hypothetical protein COV59_00695 [Candidatus Magasanikbacteria bacterium CG11_big_fil_rev_8_21_14_0_20_39_34]
MMHHKTYGDLVEKIKDLQQKKELVFVGISGLGGSGKSTLSSRLHDEMKDATLVCVDHFYLPSEKRGKTHNSENIISNCFDWDRLESFLTALSKPGCCTRYQKYNWNTDCLDDWVNIHSEGLVIVEGIYCLQDRLAHKYDLSVWVDTPVELRFERSIQRDKEGRFKGKSEEEIRKMWKEIWIPQDDRYFQKYRPDMKADILLSGV